MYHTAVVLTTIFATKQCIYFISFIIAATILIVDNNKKINKAIAAQQTRNAEETFAEAMEEYKHK